MRARWLVGGLVLLALGCGSSKKLAPVSGVVKLDGKPLAGAAIMFEPVENDNGPNMQPTTSGGKTDDNGAYTLESSTGDKGAIVGKHKVRISVAKVQQPQDPEGGGDGRPKPRSGPAMVEKLPARYNSKSDLTCDVPPDGKTDANFDLKSK